MEVYNSLDSWRKQVFLLSSSLYNGKDKLNLEGRDRLNIITNDLARWFGKSSFDGTKIIVNGRNLPNTITNRWLANLLASYNLKSIQTIIEFWRVLKYHESEDSDRLERLKHFWMIKDERKFRDYYFELYTFYLFSHNGLEYEFTGNINGKYPEGYVYINNEKCLVECKKLYYHKFNDLWVNSEITRKVIRLMSDYPVTISIAVVYDKIEKRDIDEIVEIISNKIKEVRYADVNIIYLPEVIKFNENVEIIIEILAPEFHDDFKYRLNKMSKGYIYIISNPIVLTDESKRVSCNFTIGNRSVSTNLESNERIIRAIKNKRNQWKSFDGQRIIVIESDHYPGFDRGLYIFNGYTDDREIVANYLKNKSTKDAVLVILKESNSVNIDRVRLIVDTTENSISASELTKILLLPKN